MRRIKTFIVFVILILFTVTVFIGVRSHSSYAIEVEPYLKGGTINLVEDGVSEGHKFLTALGVKTKFGEDKLQGVVTIEGWEMGEPLDEDVEIPRRGYYIGGEIGYNLVFANFRIIPTTGIAYEYMKRHRNPMYPESWKNLRFFSALLGAKMKYRIGYLKADIVVPFNLRTNNDHPKSKVGFNAETGIEYKRLTTGLFYNRVGFKETSKNPDFEFNRYGVILGIRF